MPIQQHIKETNFAKNGNPLIWFLEKKEKKKDHIGCLPATHKHYLVNKSSAVLQGCKVAVKIKQKNTACSKYFNTNDLKEWEQLG